MAYTLADLSGKQTEPLKKGVIDTFRKFSPIADLMPWETTGTLDLKFLRYKTAPTITPRNIGESFTESKGTTEPLEEQVCLLGGYCDIPRELADSKNVVVDQVALQRKMFIQAMACKFNDMFFNGSVTYDPKGMTGVVARLYADIGGTVQNIDCGTSGTPLSLDSYTDIATNAGQFLDRIQLLCWASDGPDVLFMNSQTKHILNVAAREEGFELQSKNIMNRDYKTFGDGGPLIVDPGFTTPGGSTQILTIAEDGAGVPGAGSDEASSIIAVKFGEDYLNGFEFEKMKIDDVGLLESGVSYRTIIQWDPGIYFYNPRAIARLYGIDATLA
jgi:hypothetical protein